ncbi:MAG: nucleotidyltransferase family protein [Candidatus Acidiferrales bacterium]
MIRNELMPEQTEQLRTAVTRAEMELLLCCARTRTNPEMSQRIREAAQKEIDWVQFIRLALDHDTLSVTYENLQRICPDIVPSGVLEPLRVHHQVGVAECRRLAEELVGILGFLDSHGIPAVPYKGPALAVRLYGDLSLRGFSDLDIVIWERDALRARHLLIDRGYAPAGGAETGELKRYLREQFEMPFCRADGKVHLDLHWRFTSRSTCLAGDPERFLQHLETISIAGEQVRSLRLETYLLVLSMHAAKHKWAQLKLICDIAEIMALPDFDWQYVRQEAGDLGIKRALGTGLLLAQGLLGAAVPPKLAQDLKIDRATKALAAQACTRLFEEPGESWRAEFDYTFELELRERFRDRTKIFLRYFLPKLKPNERDRAFLSLPRFLSVAYYVVRPVRLALKRMGWTDYLQ